MTSGQHVLILSSNTGGGHQSAAYALQDSLINLESDRVFVKIAQVLEDATVVSRHLAGIYNYLLRHHQDWMRYYYKFVQHFKPNESSLILKGALKYGLKMVERVAPDVVVSVHPMTQHFFAYVLRKIGLLGKIPLVTVVTDPCYGFWRGWACQEVMQYYVASDDAARQLVDYGIPSNRIQVMGMPIHSRFKPVNLEERRILRKSLDLDPDTFTVFLNAGWIGGGNIPLIYEALAQSRLPIQAVFLGGHNRKLTQAASELAQHAHIPVKVMGYTDNIHYLMNASDIMVSKLGGLTTFEALSCQLPLVADIITPPMPQEEQTTRFIERAGAGILLDKPEKIVTVVQSLLDSPRQCDMMRQAAVRCGKPGASDNIAREILRFINQKSSTGQVLSS